MRVQEKSKFDDSARRRDPRAEFVQLGLDGEWLWSTMHGHQLEHAERWSGKPHTASAIVAPLGAASVGNRLTAPTYSTRRRATMLAQAIVARPWSEPICLIFSGHAVCVWGTCGVCVTPHLLFVPRT